MSKPTNSDKEFKFPDEIDKVLMVLMKGRKNTTANHVMYDGVKAKLTTLIEETIELEHVGRYDDLSQCQIQILIKHHESALAELKRKVEDE